MSNPNPKNQFKKGNPGGPGRPRKPDFRTVIENLAPEIKELVLTLTETGQPVTPDELYVICLLLKAGRDGDIRAIEALGDRLYGKANQPSTIDYTERREFVGEIRDALTNGKSGQLSNLVKRIRLAGNGTESGDDGAGGEQGQVEACKAPDAAE